MNKSAGLYQVQNLLDGKVYYGSSTKDVVNRLNDHAVNNRSNIHLQAAIQKYGIQNFKFTILAYCCSDDCLRYEQLLLDLVRVQNIDGSLGGIDKDLSYNMCPIAGNTSGTIASDDTRKKMSMARSGSKHYNYGKKVSIELREKLSACHMGKKQSEETKQKRSIALKGKRRTPATRKNMSLAKMGEKNPMFGRVGVDHPNFGMKHTEEAKKKMSESHKGKKWSEESKQKKRMTIAAKRRKQDTE